MMNTLQDRIRGSLIGGAIGDALGYPIEFEDYETLHSRYGDEGLTHYDLSPLYSAAPGSQVAVVSDDTQMTLFTANGLLNARAQNQEPLSAIRQAYVEWYFTQVGMPADYQKVCWISDEKRLHVMRAPGTTCMTALQDIYRQTCPQNNSKGCGGVMRVAPIPLYAVVDQRMSIEESDRLAGDSAQLTHLHPLGYLSAALMAHIIYDLATADQPSRECLKSSVLDGLRMMGCLYPDYPKDMEWLTELMHLAIGLADNHSADIENIQAIGQGWVGEEALAIAVYCSLRYFDDFRKALAAAVSHGGDSDSTGSITGNLLGVVFGYEALPQDFKEGLEMHDLILHMADDLYRGELTAM